MKLPIQFPTCLRTLAVRIEGGWKHSVEMETVYIFVFLWQNKTTSWWMMRDARLRNEQSGTHHFNVVNGWKTPHKNIDVNKCSSIWNMPWFRSDSLGRRATDYFLSTGLCWGWKLNSVVLPVPLMPEGRILESYTAGPITESIISVSTCLSRQSAFIRWLKNTFSL